MIFICMTGASGAIYGIKLLKFLRSRDIEVALCISENAKKIIGIETSYSVEEMKKLSNYYYENDDFSCPFSSGSNLFDEAVIIPSSMKTIGSIANGIYSNLTTRIAHICLKEGRKLLLVPRETPLSLIDLKNLLIVKEAGAVVLPASPGFYGRLESIDDLVNFIVGKILDQLRIENNLIKRWNSERFVE